MEETILTEEKQSKINALAHYLEVEPNEITQGQFYEDAFANGSEEYRVFTDEQADEHVREEIEYSLWAFNPDFVIKHCSNFEDMTEEEFESAVSSLQYAQRGCENANGLVRALIDDMDDFVEDAVMCDGRGHFLAYYDGAENEQDGYYIYRVG